MFSTRNDSTPQTTRPRAHTLIATLLCILTLTALTHPTPQTSSNVLPLGADTLTANEQQKFNQLVTLYGLDPNNLSAQHTQAITTRILNNRPTTRPTVTRPRPTTTRPTTVTAPTTTARPAGWQNIPTSITNAVPASITNWATRNGWQIIWSQGPGRGRVAEARRQSRTIVVWHNPRFSSAFWAGAIAHEVGHAVAWQHLTPAQEQQWTRMRGLTQWQWQPHMPTDFKVGQGDFAEAIMNYTTGQPIRAAGGPLTAAQRQWIAQNIPL